MRKMLILAMAVVAVTAWSSSDSMAQDYQKTYEDSYRFGVGFGYGTQFSNPNSGFVTRTFPYPNHGTNFHGKNLRRGARRGAINQFGVGGGWAGFHQRPENPPYFAQYPPVYYNGIVSRPYGVSPYAAPPGIMPVEMMVPQVLPQSIHNPYYDQEAIPASDQQPAAEKTDNQSTHVVDPHTESLTSK